LQLLSVVPEITLEQGAKVPRTKKFYHHTFFYSSLNVVRLLPVEALIAVMGILNKLQTKEKGAFQLLANARTAENG